MSRLRAFALFWWDFVVGDDYRIALGVVLALAVTALLSRAGVTAWWLLPLAVAAMLTFSVVSAARHSRRSAR